MSQSTSLSGIAGSPAQVPSLHARLRAETRVAHDRIEAHPDLACLLAPRLTTQAYVRAVCGLHAFHACIASSLPRLLGEFLSPFTELTGVVMPDDAAVRTLARDITWFGAQPWPRMPAIPGVKDAASALGALYVAEGSALGARVIGRAVSVSLGVAPGRGASFFCGASADAARVRWQGYCATLAWAETLFDAEAGARVVGAALATFAKLEESFEHAPCAGPGVAGSRHESHSSRLAQAERIMN